MVEYLLDSQTVSNAEKMTSEFEKIKEFIGKIKKYIDQIDKKAENIWKCFNKINDSTFKKMTNSTKKLNDVCGSLEQSLKNLNNSFESLKECPKILKNISKGYKSAENGNELENNEFQKFGKNLGLAKQSLNGFMDVYQKGGSKLQEIGLKIFSSIKHPYDTLKKIFKSIIGGVKGTLVNIMDYSASLSFDSMITSIGNVGSTINDFLISLSNSFTAITSSATFAYAVFIGIVAAIAGALYQLFNTNDEFRNKVILAWENIKMILLAVYDNVIQPIFNGMVVLCRTVWETGLKPLWEEWVKLVDVVSEVVLNIWNFLSPYIKGLLELLGPVLSDAFGSLGAIVGLVISTIINYFTSLVSSVRLIFQGIIDFISGVFMCDVSKIVHGLFEILVGAFEAIYTKISTVWKLITNLFSNGGKIFDGFSNSVGKTFKSIANKIIDGINNAIQGPVNFLNGLLNILRNLEIPLAGKVFSWIDYNPIKFSPIPKLYRGGFVNAGQLFIANEPGNPELVGNIGGHTAVVNNTMILEGIQRAMRNAVVEGMSMSRNSELYVDVYLDGVLSERKLAQLNKRSYLKTGKPVFAR